VFTFWPIRIPTLGTHHSRRSGFNNIRISLGSPSGKEHMLIRLERTPPVDVPDERLHTYSHHGLVGIRGQIDFALMLA